MKRSTAFVWLLASLFFVMPAHAWTPVPVADDPLARMPGTQPGDGVVLESPNRCLNCHAGYNRAVEPGFNWGGSMMAQAARDPLYWATVVVAAQDAIWAVGNPNGTDFVCAAISPRVGSKVVLTRPTQVPCREMILMVSSAISAIG